MHGSEIMAQESERRRARGDEAKDDLVAFAIQGCTRSTVLWLFAAYTTQGDTRDAKIIAFL